jgi:homoserine acetyltransferase
MSAHPTKWPNYSDGDFIIRNYVFRSGETLPELKLHYRTLGTSKRDAAGKITNGVLLLQGNTGTVRAGAATRCDAVFHDHAGCHRARRIEQTLRRAQGKLSALPLP